MKILVISTEATPLAKAGGLADVVSAISKEWKKNKHQPIIVMPKHRSIDTEKYNFIPTKITLTVPMGYWDEYARLWTGFLPDTKVPVYLIEHNTYFNRKEIYGEKNEYTDNDRRFIFFSRAAMELCKAIDFTPNIIHAHDFHTAFALAFLKTHYHQDSHFKNTAGVYTIHNLAYQGKFNPNQAMQYAGFGDDHFYIGSWFEQFGVVNAMKVGIMFADKITTVSPTYAKEIRWDYYSEGLQNELNTRGSDLIGILNGADYDYWSPETDEHIPIKYSNNSLIDKNANKIELLKEFGLTEKDDFDLPLVGMVTRLTEQKGVDLLINVIEKYLEQNKLRLIILGSGEQRYEDFFNYLQSKYPKNVILYIGYNNSLSHKIYAASDYFLIPSRYEPCGLTQMYAMSYGTIPIVRMTGGLADTVEEYNENQQAGNGFLFWQYNPLEFDKALNRALSFYKNNTNWDKIRLNAMSTKFTAEKSANKYLEVFNWALEKKQQ